MKLLVTGGAGFIGANYVLKRLERFPEDEVIVVDTLTYAANLESLTSIEKDSRFSFHKIDIRDADKVREVVSATKPDVIVHFAAESHVDRSISGPRIFTETNVLGTQSLLDAARETGVSRFVMVSTDEVYGSLGPTGKFTEDSPIQPSSPYSASKAAADLLALAYGHTFGLDVVVTRCSNNYGPLQFPEKLIPLMIINALNDKQLPVYGDGMQVRDWIHVHDHNLAVDVVLEKGKAGEVYNIGCENERPNIEIVKTIIERLGKTEDLIKYVKDRPGHDRRYAIDASKIRNELGWKPLRMFEDALPETIDWYLANQDWWQRVQSGAYQEYFAKQYGDRLG